MSSRKEEKKDDTHVTSSSATDPAQGDHAQYQQLANTTLDETRASIRKVTDKAREEIPHYTEALTVYQEETIQAAREIAENYIESQKKISDSLYTAWYPFVKNAYGGFRNYWFSPERAAESYALAASNIADNAIAAAKLANNTVIANLDAIRISMQHAKDNAKGLSTMAVNAAKTFEQTLRAAHIGDPINPPHR